MSRKKKEKKSGFSLDKYKTHDGVQGSPNQWIKAVKQALVVGDDSADNDDDVSAEDKLTKTRRKIKI
jgi:hypothetical protein